MTDPASTAGAVQELLEAIRTLHLNAGAPSFRQVAQRTGRGGLSHSTAHTVLTGSKVPKWSTLEQVIIALGGDPESFRSRWISARTAEDLSPRTTGSRTAEPTVSLLSREFVTVHHVKAEHLFAEGLYSRSIAELDLATAALAHNRARALHNLHRWVESENEYDRRRLGEAEQELSAVLGAQTVLLGAEHPDTLRTRRNRAMVALDRGHVDASVAELQEVLVAQERVLGASHEETAQTRRNLEAIS